MDPLSRLRKAFDPKPVDFYFGPDDPSFKTLQGFHDEQMALLREKPSLKPRAPGIPSKTYSHSMRVAEDMRSFALYIGLSKQVADNLYWAVQLHDIGKLDVPAEILNKPGKLTPEEFEEMKRHTDYGFKRISALNMDHPMITLAADIAKYHHERHDGAGYYHLKGKDIPPSIRMVQICDIYDAVSAPRSYRTEKEQLSPYETMKNLLDPGGFLYQSVDQRYARPFCLLKTNILEANLTAEHHKMLEHYLLDKTPFHDDAFHINMEDIREID